MACCILAAFLVAQAVAMLRRWGIFMGVVRPRAGEDGATIFQRIRQWLRKPVVRAAVTGIAAFELAVLGIWIYAEHGTHLYQIADQATGQLRGERIIYAEQCAKTGDTIASVRIVIAANGATRSSVSYQTALMEDRPEFSGKAMIVSGASKGIGRAVAEMAARRGASLVIVGRGQAALDETAAALSAHGGKVVAIAGDIAAAGTAARAVQAALDSYGRLDIVANIVGAFPTALIEDTTDELYDQTIAHNLTGTFMMCRAALPVMRAAGGGAIVNMSSTAARLATPGLAVYGAAKAGVEAFTRAIALEGAPIVRVNAVSAGPTMTDTVRALVESDTTGAVATVTRALPLGRMAEPREIAEAVLFLASDRASVITGQVLHANSGGIMA